MNVVIIMAITFILFYGLRIMDKIDYFLENNLRVLDMEYELLIYGDEEFVYQLEKMLLKSEVKYKVIDDLSICKNQDYSRYKCIISLSDEDLNNLLICRLALNYYAINNMYSICNDIKNESIYDKYGIHTAKLEEICSQEFIALIREKLKDE